MYYESLDDQQIGAVDRGFKACLKTLATEGFTIADPSDAADRIVESIARGVLGDKAAPRYVDMLTADEAKIIDAASVIFEDRFAEIKARTTNLEKCGIAMAESLAYVVVATRPKQ